MMHRPMKGHTKTTRHMLGGLLVILWLGLSTSVLAQGISTEPAVPTGTPITTVAADAAALPDTQLTVSKTDLRYAVDFSYLNAVSPNSIAWLYQPNTTINQPVLFSSDPTYYLRRQYADRLSANGSIFMTGDSPADFSDPVITLYGKNAMDFTVFGTLSYYRENEYYQANPTLYLITPEGDYQLDIFAGIRTKLSDTDTWRVSKDSPNDSLLEDLDSILEKSFITPLPSSLPVEGDSWAILANAAYSGQGSRYVIYARKRPINYTTQNVAYVNQLDMDARDTWTRRVSVENVGDWILYAQNDPSWKKLIFEVQNSSRKRPFGDGGCGPTAVAMAIANLVSKEELPKLGAYASSPLGYRFCKCSVNDYWCSGRHLPYQLTTPEEYERYFPLAVGNFATGNNTLGVQGRADRFGTNMSYLEKIAQVFDLTVTKTNQISEAFEFLKQENTVAIACTGGYGNPFTTTSHFLVLAGVDSEYMYVLDPLQRSNYEKWDTKSYLEVIEPGLVRIKFKDAAQSNLAPIYLLQRNPEK